jgi:HlyD family secretion protein
MRRPPLPAIAAVAVIAVAGLLWLALRPRDEETDRLSGYIEGEALYLAAPTAGTVTRVSVVRGQRVAAGAPLFAMDPRQLGAQAAQQGAGVAQAEAQAKAAQAAVVQARAAANSARATAAQARRVADRYAAMRRADPGTVGVQDLEKAQAEARSTAAQVRAAEAAARNAADQADAARARIAQARANAQEVGVRADQLAPRAPESARVEEVFFQPGEWAGANQPVVSLLPDAKVKLRFFVPETTLALYRPGQAVRFSCDACGPERRAVIAYVSPRPEFTPPVIFSRQTRGRLVFLVEARPDDPAELAPGQPVDVVPLRPASGPRR